MNKSSGGELIVARKKALGLMRRKEKDEDLLLFREMHKREKDHNASLLQVVSEEFETNGQNSIYGMAPGNFLSESGKNDYDWLKTPPATPLFPSLEIESKNAPELAVQRELPIIQPHVKLTGNIEAGKSGTQRSNSPSPISKAKVFPRYSTPSSRLSSSLIPEKKNIKSAPILSHKMNQSYSEHTSETPKKSSLTSTRPVGIGNKKESHLNMNTLPANFNKSMGLDSRTKVSSKPKNREISPFIRPTIPSQLPGFPDEAPPNLRTDRSLSVSRLRPSTQTPTFTRRLEPIMQANRLSTSISAVHKHEMEKHAGKDRTQQGNNRSQILGSKMVDRVLNARMSNAEEKISKTRQNISVNESMDSRRASVDGRPRQSKTNFNASVNETTGFGKYMFRSSLNIALKNMDAKRDSSVTGSARKEFIGGRRSVSVMKSAS